MMVTEGEVCMRASEFECLFLLFGAGELRHRKTRDSRQDISVGSKTKNGTIKIVHAYHTIALIVLHFMYLSTLYAFIHPCINIFESCSAGKIHHAEDYCKNSSRPRTPRPHTPSAPTFRDESPDDDDPNHEAPDEYQTLDWCDPSIAPNSVETASTRCSRQCRDRA
jgi:hypothetical protein